jgi:AraC-like DNA-binding protein
VPEELSAGNYPRTVNGPSLGLVRHVALQLQERTSRSLLDKIVEVVGLPQPFHNDTDTRIPVHLEAEFVELATDAANDIDFGLAIGLALTFATNLPGYIAEHSKTLRDAIVDATRYVPLVRPGIDIRLDELGNVARLHLSITDPALDAYPRYIEAQLASIIGQIRAFTGGPFYPEEIGFRHQRSPVSRRIKSQLGCSVSFGTERTEMLIPTGALDRPIIGHDDMLRSLLVNHGELLSANAERLSLSFPERVELFVQNALSGEAGHVPTAEQAASALGVSRRTLSRHLKEVDTSFAVILARVQMRRAVHELKQTERSIGEIAWGLGYASQASFSTAFRRATGQTPSAFRRDSESFEV